MVGMDDSESFDMDEMIMAGTLGKWRTAAGRELVSSGAGRKRRPCSTFSIHYSPFTIVIDHFDNLLRFLFRGPISQTQPQLWPSSPQRPSSAPSPSST